MSVPTSLITRDMNKIVEPTSNVYQSLYIIGKRARQIAVQQKEEISNKLAEFSTGVDNLEEVFENREQIEISRYFERMPKASALAVDDFLEGRVFSRIRDIDEEVEVEPVPEQRPYDQYGPRR